MRSAVETPNLSITECDRCGHHVARHRMTATPATDYHRQYEQGEFLDSLAATRRHQAAQIWNLVCGQITPPDGILDFGTGRGWLLQHARTNGAMSLAGADTSPLSVDGLRGQGIEGLLLPVPTASGWDLPLGELSFRPRILTLLDVIEHFPVDRLSAMFEAILSGLRPELRFVVVKVPVADGLLYRLAGLLARIRVFGPLEQLYQVGTEPPHFSYFSRRSLDVFLASHALRVVAQVGLLEFDRDSLGARAGALRRLPRGLTRRLGAILAWVAALTWQDSRVVVAAVDNSG